MLVLWLYPLMDFHTDQGSAAQCSALSAALLWWFFGWGWRPDGDLLMNLGLTVWIHPKFLSSEGSFNPPDNKKIKQHQSKTREVILPMKLLWAKYNIQQKNWIGWKTVWHTAFCEIYKLIFTYSARQIKIVPVLIFTSVT